MDHKWIQILVIMAFYHVVTSSGADNKKIIKNGDQVPIRCTVETTSLTIWFRVLDKSGMEFIASFTYTGFLKSKSSSFAQLFSESSGQITLKSFNKERDSGLYSCASLKGNELKFGDSTRLLGEEVIKATAAPRTPKVTKPTLSVTTPPCACKDQKEPSSPTMDCAPLILGPLAGGCGLLLLLLIVTILYCNKIRTRRCPHHYKRKQRVMAPEKQMRTNRHA